MPFSNQKYKVLLAEDSRTDRLILESILNQIGHSPITVESGQSVVDAYKDNRPDIVLLGVGVSNLRGVQAASEIRKLSSDELLPIFFLTSLADTKSVVECLEAGGDDYISKPYNATILKSKIQAFGRMRQMHDTLAQQKKAIEINHKHLVQEQRVAKQVFDKIAHTGCLDSSNIRYHMSPLAVFNGDILVAEVSPTGSVMVLLGDFTGHGLPAAIGSLPLASTFYGMVHKGFSMSEIIQEVNDKLHQILPIGFFCCATCIDINFQKRRIRVWNGGLPESFLYRKGKNCYEKISTNNLPLGVLPRKSFKVDSIRIDLEVGDRFFMFSDGITEARNEQGEMFGEDRMTALMENKKGSDALFDDVVNAVQDHIGSSSKEDDISLVEIKIDDIEITHKDDAPASSQKSKLVDWSMSFEVTESTIQGFDPLPLLLNVISEVPGLRRNSTVLYTVMSELYANALDHGVLGLSSAMKSTPQGFTDFYNLRKEKLRTLENAKITFYLEHAAEHSGGLLSIRVVDSGKGFEMPTEQSKTEDDEPDFHGRGLSIMRSTCETLIIHPPGNDVEVRFRWVYEE